MARIKLKIGENELEVDSRDFYVDNQTLGEIIDNISQYLPENQAKIVYESESTSKSNLTEHGLEYLDDAETFEPEFNEPKYITSSGIKSKLKILETSRFFDSPRTVSETVQQLRGEAGDRQVKNAKIGMVENHGGTAATAVVHILEGE